MLGVGEIPTGAMSLRLVEQEFKVQRRLGVGTVAHIKPRGTLLVNPLV